MWRSLRNVQRLVAKELASLAYDPVLSLLILYSFSFAVYTAATGEGMELQNASIAVVDEDGSALSQRIVEAFYPPHFQRPGELAIQEIDAAMDEGRYTFVVDIPPGFEADVVAARTPTLQLLVDATAMSQAGRGSLYIQAIVAGEVARFVSPAGDRESEPATLAVRAQFNPNLDTTWFSGVMEVVNSVTLLAIILTGAAVIREREHGTLEHLLVMPLRPVEITLAKIAANGAVIVGGAVLSLLVVVRGILGVPLAGSLGLFATGAALYVAAVGALGVLVATLARTMPQFGLLCIPTFLILIMLSGTFTPLESVPGGLRAVMGLFPSMHFVAFSKAVLFRDAGLVTVAPELAKIALTGGSFFALGLLRFRASVAADQ